MNEIFYNHVSKWVRDHRNPETISTITDFVHKALQPAEIKERLYKEIQYKETVLRRAPKFIIQDGKNYLSDDGVTPKDYASRFAAVCRLAELTLKGYEVELAVTGNLYMLLLMED